MEEIVTAPSIDFHPSENTSFLIARLWNSWAPSFFEVPGGCYAIVSPAACQDPSSDKSKVIVIDPGFRFLKTLKESRGIGVPDIDTVIISHFHPDHVGGLFEYIALQYTYYKQTKRQAILYLNPTCRAVFGNLGPAFDVRTANEKDEITILSNFKRHDGLLEFITLKPFRTYHVELGQVTNSLGFKISIETRPAGSPRVRQARYPIRRTIALLGDTAYHPDLSKEIYSADVIVIHLGSFQMKDSRNLGKHLYAKGVLDLLTDCEAYIRENGREHRKILLISELGLEHATSSYIKECISLGNERDVNLKPDKNRSYIQLISEILKRKAEEWADVYIADLGTEIHFGEEITVQAGSRLAVR